jgi:hypothetical protein
MVDEQRQVDRGQQPSSAEPWIDAGVRALTAQLELVSSGVKIGRALTVAVARTYGGLARTAAEATTRRVPAALEPAVALDESLARAAGRVREEVEERRAKAARPGSLAVEQLDVVAAAHGVENYPAGGQKREKLEALAAVDLALEALTVDQLDRVAAANDVEGYPRGGRKQEKIAALEAAAVELGTSA